MLPVHSGIPQGSPVSPILAAYYCAELLKMFQKESQPTPFPPPFTDNLTKTMIYMYIDDGKIAVSSKALSTNCMALETEFTRVNDWLKKAGLAADLTKQELMHDTRSTKNPSATITFHDDDGKTCTLTAARTTQWLGVHFDRKLLFNDHVNIVAAKVEQAVQGLQIMGNTQRGMKAIHLRRLYTTCIIPLITYATAVWWKGKQSHITKLEKHQNTALRCILGAFRTTSIAALQIEASIPPPTAHT